MYNHLEIEKKWQEFWEKNKVFKTENDFSKPKYYCLDMFPYPSWAWLHVGHPEWYTANDIVARYKNANGFNVLHPMWWDAFWLPAENYAIKTWTHPRTTTDENIKVFKKQIKSLGFSYDWDREIDTTDPKYYKWTQWIFLKLFENWLAYEQDLPINYCPSCKTGLANEEVLNDFTCDRCWTKVEKRKIKQWVLAITKYADRLLKDVDNLDWPESIKEMQRNWIGKSEGCEFEMKKADCIKKTVLVLHWWGWSSKKWWNSWLKEELENRGYNVIVPDLPDSDYPNLQKQLKFLEQYKSELDENSIIIWHSFWAFLANHFINSLDHNIFKLIHIGWVYSKDLLNNTDFKDFKWAEDFYKSLNNDFDLDVIKNKVIYFKSYLSRNDSLIPFISTHDYYKKNNIDLRIFEDKWHFNESSNIFKFPELLGEILSDENLSISVYTTRIDTVFGMTYAVLAPDHIDVEKFIIPEQKDVCLKYINDSRQKSDQDRTAENKEKTWVFTGSYLLNPFNNQKVPLWIADYVLWNYGTWAVMAVPGHDVRDFEFAKKYDLEIKQVIASYNILTWESTPKEWFPTRTKKCATSIIKHSSEDKYLVENFTNWEICFLGGWIDWEETPFECIKREIKEECGLWDLKKVHQFWVMVWHWFKARKQQNCKDPDYLFVVELNSLTWFRENCQEDSVSYTNEWWTKDEILNSKLFKSHHLDMFKKYLWWEKAYIDDWILMDSWDFSMLNSKAARLVLIEFAEKNWFWNKKINYKLRDWLFSRQRYWWEPIPLIHIDHENLKKIPHIYDLSEVSDLDLAYILKRQVKDWESKDRVSCKCWHIRELVIWWKVVSKIYDWIYTKIICDYNLPLELPQVENYEPSWDWTSPLSKVDDFVNIRLADNLIWKRETNTMPQWGWSCWYYLRFMDPNNQDELVNPEVEKYWGQVDSYVGWAEHAVLHLLYARFWHKFLFDIWMVSFDEPFYRLRNQWLILSYAFQRRNWGLVSNDEVEEKDWKFIEIKTWEEVSQIVSKMSKSLKNVVNPDDIISEYWADSLRLYEMYMADFKDSAPWDSKNIIWVRRFLDRVWRIYTEDSSENIKKDDLSKMKILNKTIKKVWEDIENYKFNTAIAQMMISVNSWLPEDTLLKKEWKEKFLIILHPFAPHIVEELWSMFTHSKESTSIFFTTWPKYDEKLVIDDLVTIWVQVLWKLRGEIEVWIDEEELSVLNKAKENELVKKWIVWKEIVKEIYVKWKIVNIVVK